MPCESSLSNHVQPGLELREDPLVYRSDLRILARCHLSRILRGTPVSRPLRALVDLGELAYRNQIVRGGVEHTKKLRACIFQAAQFKESTTECDPRGQIGRMLCETYLAHLDGLFEIASPPVFLCKLRKSNRSPGVLGSGSKGF